MRVDKYKQIVEQAGMNAKNAVKNDIKIKMSMDPSLINEIENAVYNLVNDEGIIYGQNHLMVAKKNYTKLEKLKN